MPVPNVYPRALAAPVHPGIAKAVGLALDPVKFATTVFAAWDANDVAETAAHAGAEPDPVDTIACPLDEPAGLSNCTGTVVAPKVSDEKSETSSPRIKLFICLVPVGSDA
jgi:hypothetical protein